jgi:hypothetical protein
MKPTGECSEPRWLGDDVIVVYVLLDRKVIEQL